VLCRYGADPNVINAFGDNAITLLLSSLSRWLYHASDDPNRLDVLLRFTDDMLRLFLAHGLDPRQVLRKNLKQVSLQLRRYAVKNVRVYPWIFCGEIMWAHTLRYAVDLRIQMHTEHVSLKYGKLVTKGYMNIFTV